MNLPARVEGSVCPLPVGENDTAEQLWWSELPEPVRVEVLRLLARMIARGVVVDTDADGDRAGRLG